MPKIIIDYPDDIHPIIALKAVTNVIAEGRVSKARGRKQYCFATTFQMGYPGTQLGKIVVFARELRRDGAPDSFDVRRADG